MKELYYKVAEHVFVLKGDGQDELLRLLSQYEPFVIEPTAEVTFSMEIVKDLPVTDIQEELRQEEEGQTIVAGHLAGGEAYFEFWLGKKQCSIMVADKDYREAKVCVKQNWSFGVNNAMMVMYALATANSQTALFHSSVVSYQDKAYMFLGHSGTGKSTHSRQWLTAFEDAWLLNDDNPAVRLMENGEVWVYGTPWSGKTACYKNEKALVQALVQLAQAPENKIVRLRMTQAYPYVLSSVSGLKVQPQMMDRIFDSIAKLLEITPVYRLECLPEPSAARLCAQTCSL